MLKLLPFLLDFSTKKIINSLGDTKATKIDKVISFLLSDKIASSINNFYAAYMIVYQKHKNQEDFEKVIERGIDIIE